MSDETDVVLSEAVNLFKPLVGDAHSVLRRIMLNSRDDKLAAATAKDVLMFAGAKPKEVTPPPPVLIKDSHVQLLINVAKELQDVPGKG